MKATTVRFAVVALLLVSTVLLLRARPSNEVFPGRAPLSSLPAQLGQRVGRDITIDQQTLDILGAGEFLNRDYVMPANPEDSVDLLIAYFPSQRAGDTLHTPNHCLIGAGWVPVRRDVVPLPRADGASFLANRAVWVTSTGEPQLVIYWFQAHDRQVASEYLSKYYLVADSIRMNRSDGALIRLITPMGRDESPDAAQARTMGLVTELIPLLDNYIPR